MTFYPINGHIQIEPLKHESFISSQKESYEEIGIVISIASDLTTFTSLISEPKIKIGDKVFFDSWLAAKFPKNDEEFYWLVPYENIRAYETNEP